jgi:hypothetical protein
MTTVTRTSSARHKPPHSSAEHGSAALGTCHDTDQQDASNLTARWARCCRTLSLLGAAADKTQKALTAVTAW